MCDVVEVVETEDRCNDSRIKSAVGNNAACNVDKELALTWISKSQLIR